VGVSEYPVVGLALRNESVRVLASMNKAKVNYLVARRDRGISEPRDLRGKRVGTALGTSGQFHLARFLTLHGMDTHDITLVDLKTVDERLHAVVRGDVDAVLTTQSWMPETLAGLGPNAIVWPAQGNQPLYALAVTSDDWIRTHPDLAVRFLRSLAQAEEYLQTDEAGAKSIMQRNLGPNATYLDAEWERDRIGLSLDQSLILAMEDEARWMIANNLTNATAIPDFTGYLNTSALEEVKPGSVTIIR
jgi:NitT/TauT family transport system substrate-binding protein